MADVIDSYT